eukprot:11215025-Lingulodinium_polyedra.AAC.1
MRSVWLSALAGNSSGVSWRAGSSRKRVRRRRAFAARAVQMRGAVLVSRAVARFSQRGAVRGSVKRPGRVTEAQRAA